jgi:hypothetical protein
LKGLGYTFEKVTERSARYSNGKGIYNRKRKTRDRVHARDLLCYWVVVELGIPMVDVARRLDITRLQ